MYLHVIPFKLISIASYKLFLPRHPTLEASLKPFRDGVLETLFHILHTPHVTN
jgi:hypothetical protein